MGKDTVRTNSFLTESTSLPLWYRNTGLEDLFKYHLVRVRHLDEQDTRERKGSNRLDDIDIDLSPQRLHLRCLDQPHGEFDIESDLVLLFSMIYALFLGRIRVSVGELSLESTHCTT